MRIVLVEDNLQLARTIADGLSEDGYAVEVVGTAADGIDRGLRRDLDLMVLDLGLPDRDGLEVLHELRAARVNVPVLVLTARDAVEARVAALDAGADDYLVKPFAFAELVARIAALARRAAAPRWAPITDVPLTMRDDLVVESGDRTVALSPREYALFGCLLRRRGEVVARNEILRDAFGYEFDPGTNVIDVHLNHLRKKLQGFRCRSRRCVARGTGSWWRSDAARHPRPRAWQVIRGRDRDRGPGVPPELRTRIFEPFARGRATDRAAGTGTGLGLAICRRIVDGHGGTIFIEDRPGGGACFVVNLPPPEASKG